MPRPTKLIKLSSARRVLVGLAKHFSSGTEPIFIDGKAFTRDELAAVFELQVRAFDAVDRARALLSDAVAQERQASKRARALELRLKTVVAGRLGSSMQVLGDFGWPVPKKPGPKTPGAKLQGALKARATRQLRHTMGKQQKKKKVGGS